MILILRLGVYLHMKLGLYSLWSRLYRWFNRNEPRLPVAKYAGFTELVAFIRTLVWTADTWTEMFDAIAHPGKVEWIGRNGDRRVGDCDEFAIYIVNAIAGSPDSFVYVKRADLMSITWKVEGGEIGGHNVCLIEWTDGRYSYMDYRYPSRVVNTKEEIASLVRLIYGKGNPTISLGWTVHDKNLKVLEVHWK